MKNLTSELIRSLLPVRPQTANKGSFGRVLVVAGSRTMCGAGFLCAKSALLAGAGLVYWALPQSMQPAFAAALPEVITLPLPENLQGEISFSAFRVLTHFFAEKKPSVAVVGPGMGSSPLLRMFLEEAPLPLVADADALNFLARREDWPEHWPQNRSSIFTPHPGEMARLLHTEIATDESTRQEQVRTLCRLTNSVALLKGNGTLVGCPNGEDVQLWQNTTGGPALAKAGTGDVLAGIIAGLWAQLGQAEGFGTESAFKAALCGVYLHGLAGDLAAAQKTDYGVLARFSADCLPLAFKRVLATK